MASAGSPFQALQYAFAAHLRDPQAHAAPAGIEERRLQIYRELFFNNIENLLSIGFPVIKQLYGEHRWQHLLRRFYAEHESHTPLFTELGREFHRYLLARNERGEPDPPFLAELAHYEWVELALTIDEHEIAAIEHDPQGDVIAGPALVSPLAWLLEYRYPVHRIRADFQPTAVPAEATFLIVSRNRDDQIVFTEANPLSFKLLELLKANPGVSGLDVAQALVQALNPEDPQTLIAAATQALRQFRQRDILLGTLVPKPTD
ncbi:MAG: DUF2063 domain-containing protein [Lysobacterales bacterium CG02_land_8_20_14_3_00_62_12]|nr:MAG: DUF2063 domain-containing protein [Xanthomonadales bacterium CG02_land_8_20_14_3_00_62_12]